jgi:hypothetical protein
MKKIGPGKRNIRQEADSEVVVMLIGLHVGEKNSDNLQDKITSKADL